MIPLQFMYNNSSYEHSRRLGPVSFLSWYAWACFKFNPISVQHKGAEIQATQYGTSDFKTQDCQIFNTFKISYPIFIWLYLTSLMPYRTVFVPHTELWISTLKLCMSQPFSIFVSGEIINIPSVNFFWNTLYFNEEIFVRFVLGDGTILEDVFIFEVIFIFEVVFIF